MKIRTLLTAVALATSIVITNQAFGAITVTQSAAPAPTFSNLITFDAPGTPTGAVPNNYYSGLGLTMYSGVDANNFGVVNGNSIWPWLSASNGNVAIGNFGLFLEFAGGATSISFQGWGNAGAPSPFGGGFWVWAIDGQGNPINTDTFTPAFGGIGNEWYTVTATGSDVINRIYINNNSNIGAETIINNLSWNPVPAPGGLALLSLTGLVGGRRRRA